MHLITYVNRQPRSACLITQSQHEGFHYTVTELLSYCQKNNITKTHLYNSDPLKPHFYIVKLGFTGVYIIFLISAQKHRLWVLVRAEAVLTSTHNLCFEQKCEKYQYFSSDNFHFLVVKFSVYLNRHIFGMSNVFILSIRTDRPGQ